MTPREADGSQAVPILFTGTDPLTLTWIARRLKMGAGTYVANLIYAATRKIIKS